jgi:hypothetical protein
MNLAALTEEDWQQLLRKVRNFLQGKGPDEVTREVHETDFRHWKEQEVSPVLLAPVQVIVRYTLTQIVAENWRIDHGSIPSWGAVPMIAPDEVSVAANVNPSTRTVEDFHLAVTIQEGRSVSDLLLGDSRPYLVGSGIKEAFLFGLQMSLDHVDMSYLRRCPACTKIFFADDKRQEFCSSRCSSRERNRRLRAAAEQKAMKAKLKKYQKGSEGDGVPEAPPFLLDTRPFKRPRKRAQSK